MYVKLERKFHDTEISPKFCKSTRFRMAKFCEIPQNFADISRNLVRRNFVSTLTAAQTFPLLWHSVPTSQDAEWQSWLTLCCKLGAWFPRQDVLRYVLRIYLGILGLVFNVGLTSDFGRIFLQVRGLQMVHEFPYWKNTYLNNFTERVPSSENSGSNLCLVCGEPPPPQSLHHI
jgi:hypothetical protein